MEGGAGVLLGDFLSTCKGLGVGGGSCDDLRKTYYY